MRRVIAVSLLAGSFASSPALAFEDATWRIRNASQTRLMCALRLERGSAFIRFTVTPGRGIQDRREGFGRERVLTCQSTLARRSIFRLRAGLAYELTETSSGLLQLRIVR